MDLKKFYDAANKAEARVQEIAAQVNTLFDEGKNEEALNLRPELDKARAEAKNAQQLYLSMQAATSGSDDPALRFVPANGDHETTESKDMRASKEYSDQFWKAFKNGVSPKSIGAGMHSAQAFPLLMNALTITGGSPAGSEGGFLNPIDFDNMIHELQRLAVDLAPYFNVEEVTAYSGWRSVETAKAAQAFAAIDEVASSPATETVPAMESPTFAKVTYTLVKYGGYLPISNDLLASTPVNIMNYLARWCGRKVSLTNTSRLLTLVNALSPTAVTDYKKVFGAIKTALNVTLDPAISAMADIFVNQSGLDLLDQLLDGTGRPLLQPDPSSPTSYRVMGRQLVVVPSAQWANTDTNTKTRIAIGSGSEFATYFRRAAGELATTTVGGSAWRNDNTEIRYIMHADEAAVDSSAMALLSVTLPTG